jgi:hypothetical protein
MEILACCPTCRKSGNVPELYLGKTIRCKRCDTFFPVRSVQPEPRESSLKETMSGPLVYVPEDMPDVLVDLDEPASEPIPTDPRSFREGLRYASRRYQPPSLLRRA